MESFIGLYEREVPCTKNPRSMAERGGEDAVFFACIEAGAGLGGGSGHLAVALDDGVGELLLELDKEMD